MRVLLMAFAFYQKKDFWLDEIRPEPNPKVRRNKRRIGSVRARVEVLERVHRGLRVQAQGVIFDRAIE